jgi:hypothetical protein
MNAFLSIAGLSVGHSVQDLQICQRPVKKVLGPDITDSLNEKIKLLLEKIIYFN